MLRRVRYTSGTASSRATTIARLSWICAVRDAAVAFAAAALLRDWALSTSVWVFLRIRK